jgi:hypothetical protein
MRFFIVLFCVLSPISLNAKSDIGIYNSYTLFKEAVKMGKYDLLTSYLTAENIKYLNTNGGVNKFNDVFPLLSSFPFIIKNEINNYQLVEGDKGCITVNGLDESSEPTAINVEYKKESSSWKLDYIHVEYLSSKDEFSKKASCPQRYAP